MAQSRQEHSGGKSAQETTKRPRRTIINGASTARRLGRSQRPECSFSASWSEDQSKKADGRERGEEEDEEGRREREGEGGGKG